MKRFIYAYLLCFATTFLTAQDLIYTISGKIENQKTSLDSILVENGDVVKVETVLAFMSDVFVNREIKLHNGLMNYQVF